jgi:hypothetical protein
MTTAIQKLARALAEHDGFGAVPDETPVMLDHDNCLYELVDPESLSSRLTLGDLRAVLAASTNTAPDLSDDGPYATAEDSEMAQAAGVSIAQLRRDRAAEDKA